MGSDNRRGKHRIQPHARRKGDRVVGQHRHYEATNRCREGRHRNHGSLVQAGSGHDARIHRQDVRHRREGRDAGDYFSADCGFVFGEFEELFEHNEGFERIIPEQLEYLLKNLIFSEIFPK